MGVMSLFPIFAFGEPYIFLENWKNLIPDHIIFRRRRAGQVCISHGFLDKKSKTI
jgi:hypothetical protein